MKCCWVVQISLFTLLSFNAVANTLDTYSKKMRSLDFEQIKFVDLCTGQPRPLPRKTKLQLWAYHCGNCREKIEDTSPSKLALINVDQDSDEKLKACKWLRQNHLVSLSDSQDSIRTQIGDDYPVPAELTLENGRVREAVFGYWRSKGGPTSAPK